jgi:hypothetical protein
MSECLAEALDLQIKLADQDNGSQGSESLDTNHDDDLDKFRLKIRSLGDVTGSNSVIVNRRAKAINEKIYGVTEE